MAHVKYSAWGISVFGVVFFSPHWTSSEMGAYGFGLDFRVCVRIHVSDMYIPIIFVLGTKTTHDVIHMHIIFF